MGGRITAAVAALIAASTLAGPADAGIAAPTITGPAGRAVVITLSSPVSVADIELPHVTGSASGAFVRRLDGRPQHAFVWARYYDGYDGSVRPLWSESRDVLPAGRYAVTLLGAGSITVDFDRKSAGRRMVATRRVPHSYDIRDIPLEQPTPGRWKGGQFDPIAVDRRTVAVAHFEGLNAVGDSDFCAVSRPGDDCPLAPSDPAKPVPRFLRPDQSLANGRHQVGTFGGRYGEVLTTSYDGVTRPSRVARSLLSFVPL